MGERTTIEPLKADLIDLPAAAEILQISERTAQRLALVGQFPGDAAFRVGRQWRVSVPLLKRVLHGGAS